MPINLSVVVPAHNEAGNIGPLLAEIDTALAHLNDYEVIVVDDGSDDNSLEELYQALNRYPRLRVLRHEQRCGKAAGLVTGVNAAQAPWVVTLDGDGQDAPAEIPKLLACREAAASSKVKLVSAVRVNRNDGKAKSFASKIANRVRQFLLKDNARDSGCGFKLIERKVFLDLPVFDNMHRFLPALIKRNGYAMVEVPVTNRPRLKGASHYGILDRGIAGAIDLLGVAWLMRRHHRPVVINVLPKKSREK